MDKHASVAFMPGVESKTEDTGEDYRGTNAVQAQIQKALGYAVKAGGVLRKIAR